MRGEQSGDECALVHATQRGDGEAFAELFRRHYPAVHRACSRRLADSVEADEVAQATFVRAYERIDQCVGDRRFGPWVHVIARSLCMDSFRAQARVEPWEEPPTGGREQRPNEPEESVLSRERAAQVQEALASLPHTQRLAVVARDWDDLRPGEIADRLGVSVGAVDSLLLRGRRRLALAYRRLAGEGGGGATVLPVRSAAATIGVALAVAPQAVLAGTAAAAQAVHDGASRAAGGVVSAVVSLALGMSGATAPAPSPPTEPPAVVTSVVVADPEQAPPLQAPVIRPAGQGATRAEAPQRMTAASTGSAADNPTAAVEEAPVPITSPTTTVPARAGRSVRPAPAAEAVPTTVPEAVAEPPAPASEEPDPAAQEPDNEAPTTTVPTPKPKVAVDPAPVPVVPDIAIPTIPTGPVVR